MKRKDCTCRCHSDSNVTHFVACCDGNDDPFAKYDLDIVSMIREKALGHGLQGNDVDELLAELDAGAKKINIEPDSLYMILLDSLSGVSVCSKDDIIHQIKVMLDNSNTLKCFAV